MVKFRDGDGMVSTRRLAPLAPERIAAGTATYLVRRAVTGWAVLQCGRRGTPDVETGPLLLAMFAAEADADWLARALSGAVDLDTRHHWQNSSTGKATRVTIGRVGHKANAAMHAGNERFMRGGSRRGQRNAS